MAAATLRQSGGSVILAIPKALLEALGLGANSKVELGIQGRSLTVTPGFSIEDLVAQIGPEGDPHELIESGERGAERIEW